MIIKFKKYLITEDPDTVRYYNDLSVPHSVGDLVNATIGDDDSIPFGLEVSTNKIIYGESNQMHLDFGVSYDYRFKYQGRLWTDNKIISFWNYPEKHEFKGFIKKLEKALDLKIFNNDWRIEIMKTDNKPIYGNDINFTIDREDADNIIELLIPIEDYAGSDDNEEGLKLHLMKPAEKAKKLKEMGYKSKVSKWKKWQKPFEKLMTFEKYTKRFVDEYKKKEKVQDTNLTIDEVLKKYTYNKVLLKAINNGIKSDMTAAPKYFIKPDLEEYKDYNVDWIFRNTDIVMADEEKTWCYDELVSFLEQNRQNKYLRLYRKMTLPDDVKTLEEMMKHYDGVGKYWSFKKSRLDNFETMTTKLATKNIILEADVAIGNIEWENTFLETVGYYPDEREILIKDNTTINLIKVDDKKLDKPVIVTVGPSYYKNGEYTTKLDDDSDSVKLSDIFLDYKK